MYSSQQSSPAGIETLVAMLRRRASDQFDQTACTFLLDGESDSVTLSYGDLDTHARAVAALLQQEHKPGERALLLFAPGPAYIAAFFGCLYAGIVAVPAYPPANARALPRLQAMVADAQATLVLTSAEVGQTLEQHFAHTPAWDQLRCHVTTAAPLDLASTWRQPRLSGDDLAFLQYTSGSTRAPKGVMLTHANLLHNLQCIQTHFEYGADSRSVSWLPPYHDMGLIGGILEPLYAGFPVTLMPPVAFLQRPLRWLQAISATRATSSGGPNFAYDLCVQRITPEQCEELDLSCWRNACSGAEPVRPTTLRRFAELFGPCGFRYEAFYPCYGLAEATLLVTGGLLAAPPVLLTVQADALRQNLSVPLAADQPGQTLVGCGQACGGQQVQIVDPETCRPLAEGQIGEIWLRGPSVAQGYWNSPKETQRVFQARLTEGDQGPFLRTGDLGFLRDGELFVSGRRKDVIIVRGRNYYPQDIEHAVEQSHAYLRPNAGAAFQVTIDDEDRLVVVQEVAREHRSRDLRPVLAAIREAVTAQFEIQVSAVVLVRPSSVPKTSSGKIQRHACREAFVAGRLDVLVSDSLADMPTADASAASAPALDRAQVLALSEPERRPRIEQWLGARLAALGLPQAQLDPRQPLIAAGLDSLTAIELQHAVERALGVQLPLPQVLEGGSIATLAAYALAHLPETGALPVQAGAPAPGGEAPMAFGQQALWLVHQLAPESAAYTVARAMRLRGPVDIAALRAAIEALVARHAALRASIGTAQGELVQRIDTQGTIDLGVVDVATCGELELLEQLRAAASQPFRNDQKLLRVWLFRRSDGEHVLMLAAHHVLVDFWSFAIMLEDLGALYTATRRGVPAALPPVERQYADFVHWQRAMLAGDTGKRHAAFWQAALAGAPTTLRLPTDRPRPAVQSYHGSTQTRHLPAALARQLKASARAQGATLYTMLLAAFQVLLGHLSGQNDLLVGSPMAGRTQAGWGPVVGYFVNPVVLRARPAGNLPFAGFLGQAQRDVLAAIEHQDYPFALLVERMQIERDLSRSPLFQAMFIFQQAQAHSPRGLAALALDQGGVRLELGDLVLETMALELPVAQFDLTLRMAEVGEELVASLEHNTGLFDTATAAGWLAQFEQLLEAIAEDGEQQIAKLTARLPRPYLPIRVAATFTAEPLEPPLAFWLQALHITAQIEHAPYNQIFQQLLDPSSLLRTNDGVNLILLRVEDWLGAAGPDVWSYEQAARRVAEFVAALRATVEQTRATYLVCVCPPSEAARQQPERHTLIARAAGDLGAALREQDGGRIVWLDTDAIIDCYAVRDVDDPITDRSAHIPYTEAFFVALSTVIARTLLTLQHAPFKAIVLDCDETLWAGRCGEDGYAGIVITPAHRLLQEWLVRQHDAGMLLCLCSKNDEADVLDVFHHHPEMPLQLEHIVARRINWQAKSRNLVELATELQIGVDSCIFLDDSPVECAEVRAGCPEVLAIQLPADPAELPAMLAHLWGADRQRATWEDRQRTQLYQQNQRREQFRAEQPSLDDFLEQLDLRISIAPLEPAALERVAQLTLRTNQFNTTTIRRSEADIQQWLAAGQGAAWTVHVADRFGDYGLVGAMLAACEGTALVVDSMLLSCRALGKHVEDTMLAWLAQQAQERGCETLVIAATVTRRNTPALNFLSRAGLERQALPDGRLVFSATTGALLASPLLERTSYGYRFGAGHAAAQGVPNEALVETPARAGGGRHPEQLGLLSRIAAELRTADQILAWMQAQRQHERPALATDYIAPQAGLEQTIVSIWREVLGVERIGTHDNFFDLGGHSMLLARVHSRLQAELRRELPLITLFRHPTVHTLALALGQPPTQLQGAPLQPERAVQLRDGRNRLRQLAQKQPAKNKKP